MQAGELVIREQSDPAFVTLADHHGRIVPDVGSEIGIQFVQVQQVEWDAEIGHGCVPRRLAAERGVGDVAETAGLAAQVVAGEVAQLSAQPAVGTVDAD